MISVPAVKAVLEHFPRSDACQLAGEAGVTYNPGFPLEWV